MSALAITTVDLARIQFATTSLYHFLFVPLTLGLAPLVAVMQTLWYRSGDEGWLRLTRFFGTLMLINFAIGVATGLVQEFQFGMNWSVYSVFVGDVFGAPLAIEGLAAFLLEATFLGLWIFGWDRLSPRVHLATVWLFALGTWLSAFFIIVANSWMQRPVGSTSGRPRRADGYLGADGQPVRRSRPTCTSSSWVSRLPPSSSSASRAGTSCAGATSTSSGRRPCWPLIVGSGLGAQPRRSGAASASSSRDYSR